MPDLVHQLAVDNSEARSALLEAVRRTGSFEVRMGDLPTGDYLIDNEVLIERKSVADFAASLIDGRLFPQVARLAHSRYRSLLLIEGPTPTGSPDVHPHSLEGALVSIAAMWRLPVLHSSDAEQSVRMLRFLADQVRGPQERVLRRFD
jgi:DNA excision repair protein ERCC-4